MEGAATYDPLWRGWFMNEHGRDSAAPPRVCVICRSDLGPFRWIQGYAGAIDVNGWFCKSPLTCAERQLDSTASGTDASSDARGLA